MSTLAYPYPVELVMERSGHERTFRGRVHHNRVRIRGWKPFATLSACLDHFRRQGWTLKRLNEGG